MRTYRSAPAEPGARGEDFGAAHAAEIAANLARYDELFGLGTGELQTLGDEAHAAIATHAPAAADELAGMAAGAGLPAWRLALLNARTEVLARLDVPVPGECSTVVAVGPPPVTLQTWDWHDDFADGWLVWTIEHHDGRVVRTVTEHGILGKIGVNAQGVGVHFNILHHGSDGGPFGLPLHVLARTVLDRARDAGEAVALLGAAPVSASSVLTVVGAGSDGAVAVCAELAPAGPRFVTPDRDGLLVHTNHFLDVHLAAGDREPRLGPNSFLRRDVLLRALDGVPPRDRDALLATMASHAGGTGAVCCHPADDAPPGERWQTLATVGIDVAAGDLHVRSGGPCDPDATWHVASSAVTQGAQP